MRHFIPIVNRIAPLLPKALEGCKPLWPATTIIDNSDENSESDVPLNGILKSYPGVTAFTPSVPLSTAQTMNLMLKMARREGLSYFTWQHLDAICIGDTAVQLHQLANELNCRGANWGVILTKSELCPPRLIDGVVIKAIATDAYAAYNVNALTAIGGWDWIRFPFYVLDSDMHTRLSQAGYTVINSELPVDHSEFSQTLSEDGERREIIDAHWPLWRQLFAKKNGIAFWDYELYS